MPYKLQFRNCKDQSGSVKIPDSEAYTAFATYSDLLFTNQPMNIDLPGAAPGSHIDLVALVYSDTLATRSVMVASVSLLCECHVEIKTEERAKSRLITP